MSGRPTVVIADAEPTLRMGVRTALEKGGFRVCAEARDAAEALAAAAEERPDLCLLDVMLPGGGIDVVRQLAERLPETRIVMLTASAKEQDLFDAVTAGANGYLLKDTDPQRLPMALYGVLGGEAALPRALMLRIIEKFRALEAPGREGSAGSTRLTERERAVLDRLRAGRTTAAIANELGISAITARRHISQVVRKLGVSDRQAAVRLAQDPPP